MQFRRKGIRLLSKPAYLNQALGALTRRVRAYLGVCKDVSRAATQRLVIGVGFREKSIAASVWLAIAGMLVATDGFAGIYMGTNANIAGPAYDPAAVQPLPVLQPPPTYQVARVQNNAQTYHKTVKPTVPPCQVTRPCNQPAKKVASKPVAKPATAKVAPKPYIPQPKPESVYYVSTGSLRDNVNHIVDQSEWGRVIWNVPYDYRWVGNITIHAISAQDALTQLLDQYPVQATFYEENHVVAITPRRQA